MFNPIDKAFTDAFARADLESDLRDDAHSPAQFHAATARPVKEDRFHEETTYTNRLG